MLIKPGLFSILTVAVTVLPVTAVGLLTTILGSFSGIGFGVAVGAVVGVGVGATVGATVGVAVGHSVGVGSCSYIATISLSAVMFV